MTALSIRVVTLNLQQGGGARIPRIVADLASLQPDIAVLTEFHPGAPADALAAGLAAIGLGHMATTVSQVEAYPNAVAIASRDPLEAVLEPLGDTPNHHRVLEVVVGGVRIAGVYFPLLAPKVAFWRKEFLPYAQTRLGERSILIGDWNSGTPFLDEAGATLHGAKEFAAMSSMGWTDAWRSRNPETREFSWYSPRPHRNGFRLDHAFLSPSLAASLSDVYFAHQTRELGSSDHSALVVDLGNDAQSANSAPRAQ